MGNNKHQSLRDPSHVTFASSGTPTSSTTLANVGARRAGSRKIVVRNLALAAPFRLWRSSGFCTSACSCIHCICLSCCGSLLLQASSIPSSLRVNIRMFGFCILPSPPGKNMVAICNALLVDRENDRIVTAILCHEMSVHGNQGFGRTGAMATHRDIYLVA